MKLVYIAGLGTSIYSRSHVNNNISSSYNIFSHGLEDKYIEVFDWSKSKKFSLFQLYTGAYFAFYKEERSKIFSSRLKEELSIFLTQYKPEKIFAHSLGGLLLIKYIEECGLPENIRDVIFANADIARNESTFLQYLKVHTISCTNFFSPYDKSLIGSSLVNKYLPAGLVGHSDKYVKNIGYYPPSILHTHEYILHDKSIETLLLS